MLEIKNKKLILNKIKGLKIKRREKYIILKSSN